MRASPDKKAKFAALAAARGMSETALLSVLVDHVLEDNPSPAKPVVSSPEEVEGASTERITIRLRPGDRPLLEARAAARGMKPSSYLVALVRSHMRGTAPLPAAEFNHMKAAVGELSAIGRNLNQIARAVNAGGGVGALKGLLKDLKDTDAGVQDLRRSIAELVRVNLMSWEAGDG